MITLRLSAAPRVCPYSGTLEDIRINKELVAICPMILDNYAGPHDEAMDDDIHVHDHTAMYGTDNKIVLREHPISSAEALCDPAGYPDE